MVISHEASKYVIGCIIGRPFYGQRLSWKPSILQFVDFVATLSSAKPDEVISCFSVWLRPVCQREETGSVSELIWTGNPCSREKVNMQYVKMEESWWIPGWNCRFSWSWYDFGAQFAMFTASGWVNWSSKPYVDLIILVAHHPVWTHTQLLIHSHTEIHVGRLMQTLPSPPNLDPKNRPFLGWKVTPNPESEFKAVLFIAFP